ncbi:hypothetical protein BDF19DRAFT_183629 [Syncephalis fuscata]|nr:hypothetical protein BDF19DRAFT_183629 [Syncephalis fuscata]
MRLTKRFVVVASVALLVIIASSLTQGQTNDLPIVGGASKGSSSTDKSSTDKSSTGNSSPSSGSDSGKASSGSGSGSGSGSNGSGNPPATPASSNDKTPSSTSSDGTGVKVSVPGAKVDKVITSLAPAATVTVSTEPRSADGANGNDGNNGVAITAGGQEASNNNKSNSGLSIWAIVAIVCGGVVALCAGLAAYSRWTRKGRNRRFEELQFGAEDTYGASQHPFAHRAYNDPFKKDLGAHHHGGYP